MEREQRVVTAYHEAGHAVMAMANGFKVIEIVNDSGTKGDKYVRFDRPQSPSPMDRRRLVIVLAAGAAADFLQWDRERVQSGSENSENDICEGHYGDQQDAAEHLLELGGSAGFLEYVIVAQAFFQRPGMWDCVERFADLMQNTSRLNARAVLDCAFAQVPKIRDADITLIREYFEPRSLSAQIARSDG